MTTSTLSRTTGYAEEVVAGNLVTSKRVRQACERHLSDIERSKSRAYPYEFDAELAERPLDFIETFCIPSQGSLDRFELQPWDDFVIGSLFGWVEKKTRLRRFRSGLVFVARKNGKSTKASGLSLYCCSKDGERGARVYLLANAMKQVRATTYQEAQAMVKASPDLRKHFRPLRDAIHYDKDNSQIVPQASDSETLDGLNCHLGIFDEIHEYKDYRLVNVIKNSTAARKQPLLLYITTAGYVLDGPLMDMYERGCDCLDGVLQDERTFYYLAELDSEDEVDDPTNWVKANPNLGISVSLEDMVAEWNERKDVPAERGDFITKRLNLFVRSSEQAFVDFEVLKRNEKVIEISELKGKPCIAGFDLSQTEDFTAAALEFQLDDEIFVMQHSWVPEARVKLDQEGIPYREWEKDGYLTICPGEFVDYRYVYDWFVRQSKVYTITRVTFDPYNAYRLVADLQALGGEEWTKVVRQGAITLNGPLKDLKELLIAGKVVSNKDPLLRWYINNIRLVDDRNGNWLPSKQGRYRKIDGFAAWLNAHTETMALPTPSTAAPVTFISRKDL